MYKSYGFFFVVVDVVGVIFALANPPLRACRAANNSASFLRKWIAIKYASPLCTAVELIDTHLQQLQWSNEEIAETMRLGQLREFYAIDELSCPSRSEDESNVSIVSKYANVTDDPFFPAQWYLQDCRTSENELQYDINVIPVWKENNFGQGVVVMIIDDGVETTHDDLIDNYDANYGLDLVDRDNTPDAEIESSHGTRSAGVIAMSINNAICGAGIAPAVTLGAVRLLAPNIRPSYEDMVQALVFRMHDVDITSNSWSVNDDGQQMPYPDVLLRTAFKAAAIEGRRGKGVIHVFSAGNGKKHGDMCGCDLLLNAIHTIGVASCDYQGRVNSYSERCSAVMVTAYSGDGSTLYNVISATTNNSCTIYHTGTSAAAPMVAGVIALVLRANPQLDWRAIQHLLTFTSRVAPLRKNRGWRRNAAELFVSEDFGFGLIDAHRLTQAAKTFKSPAPMSTCVVPVILHGDRSFGRFRASRIQFTSEGCTGTPMEVNFMEHVQLQVFLSYSRRGDLLIRLTSPGGTEARLLEARAKDESGEGLKGWTFDSVMSWGESPRGVWTVDIHDLTGPSTNAGSVKDLFLVIYGTREKPSTS